MERVRPPEAARPAGRGHNAPRIPARFLGAAAPSPDSSVRLRREVRPAAGSYTLTHGSSVRIRTISMDEGTFASGNSDQKLSAATPEQLCADQQRAARVRRLYGTKGGPLLAWLREERLRRGDPPERFCAKLGTTRAYLSELWQAPKKTKRISADFARRCGDYLRVPPIVVRVLAEQVTLADFIPSSESEEEAIDRVRQVLLTNPMALQMDAMHAPGMHEQFPGADLFGLRWLPGILEWLEPAVQIHFGHATEAKLMAIGHGQPADKAAGQVSEEE